MLRIVLAWLLLALAPAVFAQLLQFSPQNLVIEVGETAAVGVTSLMMWSVYDVPWTFTTGNSSIIRVAGRARSLGGGTMYVTGLRPGKAKGLVAGLDASTYFVSVTVRCGVEPPVQAAEPLQTAKIGEPVTLRAVTPIAERTIFTWYHGLVGDMTAPIAAAGPELVFAAGHPGQQYAWVMATTPCSSSTAQFAIDATAPKRRGARH